MSARLAQHPGNACTGQPISYEDQECVVVARRPTCLVKYVSHDWFSKAAKQGVAHVDKSDSGGNDASVISVSHHGI